MLRSLRAGCVWVPPLNLIVSSRWMHLAHLLEAEFSGSAGRFLLCLSGLGSFCSSTRCLASGLPEVHLARSSSAGCGTPSHLSAFPSPLSSHLPEHITQLGDIPGLA